MAANEYDQALEDLGPEPDLGAAPGDDQNPYAELLREQHQGQATALRVTARAAAATPPDQAAQVLRLANRLQVPPSIVARNLPWFDQQDRLQATPYEQILRETPTLGAWLQQPEHAAVAQDNLPVLRRLEGVLRGHAQAEAAGPAGAESFNPNGRLAAALPAQLRQPGRVAGRGIRSQLHGGRPDVPPRPVEPARDPARAHPEGRCAQPGGP